MQGIGALQPEWIAAQDLEVPVGRRADLGNAGVRKIGQGEVLDRRRQAAEGLIGLVGHGKGVVPALTNRCNAAADLGAVVERWSYRERGERQRRNHRKNGQLHHVETLLMIKQAT